MAYDDRKSITFTVEGEPVPWSSPERMKWGGSKPNPRLTGWQAKIADVAREAFGPLVPWLTPISFCAEFRILRSMPKSAKFGDEAAPEIYWDDAQNMYRMRGKASDLTNLTKAAEDALELIVYVNDAQVTNHGGCNSIWSKTPGVTITIIRMM